MCKRSAASKSTIKPHNPAIKDGNTVQRGTVQSARWRARSRQDFDCAQGGATRNGGSLKIPADDDAAAAKGSIGEGGISEPDDFPDIS